MSPLDIGLCFFLVVAWHIYARFVEWPRFHRLLERMPPRARRHEFRLTLVQQWVLAAIAAFVWLQAGRSWESIGMRPVIGWRLWGSASLSILLFTLQML